MRMVDETSFSPTRFPTLSVTAALLDIGIMILSSLCNIKWCSMFGQWLGMASAKSAKKIPSPSF